MFKNMILEIHHLKNSNYHAILIYEVVYLKIHALLEN